MNKQKPKAKYYFDTGKIVNKVKKVGYKYLGRGKVGVLNNLVCDGKKIYYLEEPGGFAIISPYSFDKLDFVKVEYWEENLDWGDSFVIKQRPKDKLIINTKILRPKKMGMSFCDASIKLTKEDSLPFFEVNKSELIRKMQLKNGDKLRITIEKLKKLKGGKGKYGITRRT